MPYFKLTKRQRRLLADPDGYIAREKARQAAEREKREQERRPLFPDSRRCYLTDSIGFHRHYRCGPDWLTVEGVQIYGDFHDCGVRPEIEQDWYRLPEGLKVGLGHPTPPMERSLCAGVKCYFGGGPHTHAWRGPDVLQVQLGKATARMRACDICCAPEHSPRWMFFPPEVEVEHSDGHEPEVTTVVEASPTTDQETEAKWSPPTSWKTTTPTQLSLMPGSGHPERLQTARMRRGPGRAACARQLDLFAMFEARREPLKQQFGYEDDTTHVRKNAPGESCPPGQPKLQDCECIRTRLMLGLRLS